MLLTNRLWALALAGMALISLNVQANSQWTYQNNSSALKAAQPHIQQQVLKDPTKPARYAKPAARRNHGGGHLVLNSVMITKTLSYAVINNRIYHQGEKVRGIRISQITQDHVQLANGRKLTLFKSVNHK